MRSFEDNQLTLYTRQLVLNQAPLLDLAARGLLGWLARESP